jgi:hypothetical protein
VEAAITVTVVVIAAAAVAAAAGRIKASWRNQSGSVSEGPPFCLGMGGEKRERRRRRKRSWNHSPSCLNDIQNPLLTKHNQTSHPLHDLIPDHA